MSYRVTSLWLSDQFRQQQDRPVSFQNVLVTGANGFIGQNLCSRLVESGKQVTACIREQADASALQEISGPVKIHRLFSLGAENDLSKALSHVDVVIHLAGRAHVMHEIVADPLKEFRRVNVGGTERLASIAAKMGVRRFIYVSSIKVNGEGTKRLPFGADDSPGYCDPYGQSKWEAEERLRQIAEIAQMEWVVVRPPLVYGPAVRGNFLTLLKTVLRQLPFPVGSLHNAKSLVSVFNLNDFISLLVDHPAAANNRFMVADERDISTPDLIRSVAAALHCPVRIVPCPELVLRFVGSALNRKAAIDRLCSSLVVDRQKTKDLFGWSAPTTLDWGLERTVSWFLSTTAE